MSGRTSRKSALRRRPDSLESNVSEYRLKSKNLVGYATFRPVEWLDIGAKFGWLKPSSATRRIVQARSPDARGCVSRRHRLRSARPADVRPHRSVDHRRHARLPGHPTRGGLYPRRGARTIPTATSGLFSFRRYEAEAAGFVPLADSRVVIALHGWLVASDTDDGQFVPFYLQPSLGGHNTLRSYADYRFHDRNLIARQRRSARRDDDARRRRRLRRCRQRRRRVRRSESRQTIRTAPACACTRAAQTFAPLDVAHGERRVAIPLPAHRSAESRRGCRAGRLPCRSFRRRREQ